MPAVQVRDFSQETYDLLKQEAKQHGRSITQQTKHIVNEHFALMGMQPAAGAAQGDQVGQVGLPYAGMQEFPFGYLEAVYAGSHAETPFSVPAADAAKQRSARRKALKQRIASRRYPASALAIDSAALVREMRDER